MKKILTIFMVMGIIVSLTASPVFARNQRVGHPREDRNRVHYPQVNVRHHYVSHHGDWGLFGFGLITGAVVTSLFYDPPPPPRPVVVHQAPAVVRYSDPVIIYKPPAVIEVPGGPMGEAVVTAALLNVRSGPGKNHPVTHQIWKGSRLVIRGSSGGWIYVRLPSGEYGWVMQEFTVRVQSSTSG